MKQRAGATATKRHRLLSAAEEHAFAVSWQKSGDGVALARLVESQLALVAKIASAYRAKTGCDATTEDLYSAGCEGLVIAARTFDPERGTRLSTHASHWIKAKISSEALATRGPVRFGTTRDSRKVYFNLGRARRSIEDRGGNATPTAIARELGVDEGLVADMIPRVSRKDVWLDAPTGGVERGLVCSDETPEEAVARAEGEAAKTSAIERALGRLSERERAIVRLRHLAERRATLTQLSARLGVSRERVRQLEAHALGELKRVMHATNGRNEGDAP